MTLVRRAMLFCAVGLLAASAAMAGVPSAVQSSQPATGTVLVFLSGSTPDITPGPAGSGGAGGVMNYTIRDASNNPVPGSVLIFAFGNCHDTQISSVAGAGVTINCAAKTVTAVTNSTGQVQLAIAGNQLLGGAATFGRCVAVTADGVSLNNLSAAAPDYVNTTAAGLNLLDVGACKGDVGTTRLRSDMDGDGTVTLLDVGAVYGYRNKGPWPNDKGTGADTTPALCP